MSRGWDDPKTIITEIDIKADRLKEKAFPHNGFLHFYSGPSKPVMRLILGQYQYPNRVRATEWAKAHGAMIIDNSPIGQYLITYRNMGTFEYFKRNPLFASDEEKETAAILPWKHASHLLALSAYGQISTTVAGANRRGVYYTIELKNSLDPNYYGLSATEFLDALSSPRKTEVEAINLIPFGKVLAEYNTNGIEAAHTMIQLGEIRMALQEAFEHAKPAAIKEALKLASKEVLRSPAEAYKYFLESRERFQIDRALQMKGTPEADNFFKKQTPVVRKNRRERRLNRFSRNLLKLIETEVALMPPADRPDFIVPPYVKTPSL